MKLEEGMYVRFEGVLCRIDEIEDNHISFDRDFYDHWNELTMSMDYERFINHYNPKYSFNIIDLIQVGDYVNGYRVNAIINNCLWLIDEYRDGVTIESNEIKDILTKEQYENMVYKIY